MLLRSPQDLGAILRDRRKELGLDQATLAQQIGVNRKWIIGAERGRARAELGLVLRVLNALGLGLDITIIDSRKKPSSQKPTVDIDAIVDAARKPRR